jgi:pyruvate, water dikinase
MTVLFLDQPECQEAGTAGGKGASLARMASLGVAVPPAFVVSADALVAALPDGGEELRRIVAAAEDDRLDAVAERARRIVLAAETSPALREQIAAAHRRLGDGEPSVAVRSSACAEDSEAASFAGQQETYLHVRGEEQVVSRIGDCWASFFSERALFYRSRKGSLEDLGIAVVIQRMVDAVVSGVMFTCDPVHKRRDAMVVEAVFGLGEAVVSGRLTPDHYVVRRDGEVKRRRLHPQPFAVVRSPEGGTRERPLTEQEGSKATLDEARLRELARIGDQLERRLGGAQDIEWALEDGLIYVLQSRPVTA